MNSSIEVIVTVEKLMNKNICDVLDENEIEIFETDNMPKNTDAMILESKLIFLRSSLDQAYKDFLVAHELGHLYLHEDNDFCFTNLLRLQNSKMEQEANTFACLFLMRDENLNDVNVIERLINKGVPENIAARFYDWIRDLYRNHQYEREEEA